MSPFYNVCWLIAVQNDPSIPDEARPMMFSSVIVLLIGILILAVAVVGVGLAIFLVMRANSRK
ncbi:MAG: hypothetical protein GY818_16970 [Planctomycetaceae bacterium]|nr:hypothetical protein [Planctomycetaceae bacterium]